MTPPDPSATCRHLLIVLGDQLNRDATLFDGMDPGQDRVWMAEVAEESTHVPSHVTRIVMFLSAMRHFVQRLEAEGWPVTYWRLEDPATPPSLAEALRRSIETLQPQGLVVVQPGEWRVLQALRQVAEETGLPLEVREDDHFLCRLADFERHRQGRKQLRMEFFYREMRQRTGILMEGKAPVGGQWNFDKDNRQPFGKNGPGLLLPPALGFPPDALTQAVIQVVQARFPHHPGAAVGALEGFDWPVTPEDAQQELAHFIQHKLPQFGPHQDAMWTGEPWLYHSRISAALNVKLLNPREVLQAAEDAYHQGAAPLESVEGFIRQILGWREYVRGIYWAFMPEYLEGNALGAQEPLPALYWTGETDLHCLAQTVGQTLRYGYAHHIQRLMVTGLFALLLGVRPQEVHAWYLAVYLDAVEWVELPNTLGMSQFGDGGLLGSKPYVATGKYIQRMSNYCAGCRYDPGEMLGDKACPFTTLYWDFLIRHQALLSRNPRMGLQLKNLQRLSPEIQSAIQKQADAFRQDLNPTRPPAAL